MSHDHRTTAASVALTAALALAMAALQGSPAQAASRTAAASSTTGLTGTVDIDSRWFPLRPGTQYVYDGTVVDEEGSHHHRVIFTVTSVVKRVDGVRTIAVWDRDIQDGELQEAELALFAQDERDNVHSL